jgi:hypothetical protein
MDRLPVKSSNIAAIGYDSASKTLEVEFKTGAAYSYSDVPPSVARSFRKAQSIGGYFSSKIKNKFNSKKL